MKDITGKPIPQYNIPKEANIVLWIIFLLMVFLIICGLIFLTKQFVC